MSGLQEALSFLKENIQMMVGDEVKDLSDENLVDYATNYIASLEVENTLLFFAIEQGISGPTFERWYELANQKIASAGEDEEIGDKELLDLLKQCRD